MGKVPGCIVIVCMFAGKPDDEDEVTLVKEPKVAGFMTWIMLSLSMEKNRLTEPGEVMELLLSSGDVINVTLNYKNKNKPPSLNCQ